MKTCKIHPGDAEKFASLMPGMINYYPMDFIVDTLDVEDFMPLMNGDGSLSYHYGNGDGFVLAQRMNWDSEFFGREMAKIEHVVSLGNGEYFHVLSSWLRDISENTGIKHVFIFAMPEEVGLVQSLCAVGFRLVSTRFYYYKDITRSFCSLFDTNIVRFAEVSDLPVLQDTVLGCVNPYDRFHSDPIFSTDDANRLMSKWVENSIDGDFADFVLAPERGIGKPKAFVTAKTHEENWDKWGKKICQPVVLGAVSHEYKGWYSKLIKASECEMKCRGADFAYWKTQSTNRDAIRTAEKLGYKYGRSELVFSITL